MKKLTLSVFVFMLMFAVIGIVSADISGVTFNSPISGSLVTGTTTVSWTNTESWTDLALQYRAGGCGTGGWVDVVTGIGASTTTYPIDTTTVADGVYCLRITNYGGATESGAFNISNNDPVCSGIIAPTDGPVGYPITFDANAATTPVEVLTYDWSWGDGEDDNTLTNPTTHTYDATGTYVVDLTATDPQGAFCQDQVTITIHPVTVLPDQEVVALGDLTTDFEISNGSTANTFATGLVPPTTCTNMMGTGPTIGVSGNDCGVTWIAVPNSFQGTYTTLVEATDTTNYEYYVFDTTVYSWAIDLVPGWNLISIPLVPTDGLGNTDTSIDNVFIDQLEDTLVDTGYPIWSYQYDEDEGENAWFKNNEHGSSTSSSALKNVVPGYGYWVNMEVADTLYGFGDKTYSGGEYGLPPAVKLLGGWNLIGKFGLVDVPITQEINDLSYDITWSNDLANCQVYDMMTTTDINPYVTPGEDMIVGAGYAAFMQGNNGNPIEYTASSADYTFL